jgi:hypothetical protein
MVIQGLDEVRLTDVQDGGEVAAPADAAVASVGPRQLLLLDQVAAAHVLLPASGAAVVVRCNQKKSTGQYLIRVPGRNFGLGATR